MPNKDTGYAAFQLARALSAAESNPHRINAWTAVVSNILSGAADYGSRTPIKNVPVWVTPEVVSGGYATGHWLAGGPLLPFERQYLAALPPVADHNQRLALNTHFLSDAGMLQLQEMLDNSCYEINVPEEGALLVVAWLARHGYAEQARQLIEELAPFFSRLRFYPVPTAAPRRQGPRVHVQSAGEVKRALQAIRPKQQVLAQREAVMVWAPFNDRVVALFSETCRDGWPCRVFAPDWKLRAAALLNEYAALRARHTLCRKQDKPSLHYAKLRALLQRCAADPAALTPAEVGTIRMIVNKNIDKHGQLGETKRQSHRALQARDVAGPLHRDIAAIVVQRIDRHPLCEGIEDAGQLRANVLDTEASDTVAPGTPVPPSIRRKAMRCQSDSLEGLIKANLIPSGEVMAQVLPQMSSGLSALSIPDQPLRDLYAAIHRAFRRRRSLLLLNLDRQARLDELPWIAAANQFRGNSLTHKVIARQALGAVASLALTSYPYSPLPNKLLQELAAIASYAGVDLPLTEELAADIFMGQFSGKFNDALRIAEGMLDKTLYALYYGIDYGNLQADEESPAKQNPWFRRPQKSPGFDLARICAGRAGVPVDSGRPATNGMVIEQQQILTSQNLATLFAGLQLGPALQAELPGLSRQCFRWICHRLQRPIHNEHSTAIRIKNAAYAWRQMVFFLALQRDEEVADFIDWARAVLAEQSPSFQKALSPAWKGLLAAVHGVPIDQALGARRFLGWSNTRHWLASAH